LPVTAVLTGATGFLGLHLIRGLLAGTDRLVVLARGDPSPLEAKVRLLAGIGR
jgi:thioester reductase-like protein